MKKNLIPPVFAFAAGLVGFGLRKWQLATGFEPDTALPVPGAPAALILILWSALSAVVLLVLCRNMDRPQTLERAFDARGNPIFLTAVVLSGFLLLVSAGADIVTHPVNLSVRVVGEENTFLSSALPLLRIFLSALGCLCVLVWARKLYREPAGARESLSLLELCLLFCVWLISDYQTRASDPVTMNYLYEVLAIVCALLALYYLAGWSFQTGKPRRTAIFCFLAVYFSLVTLADGHSLAEAARYGFVLLFLTAHAALLLIPHQADEDAPTTEETEETPHE